MELILNLCIYLPLAGIAAILLIQGFTPAGPGRDRAIKWTSLAATLAVFGLSLPLMLNFDVAGSATVQYLTEGAAVIEGMDIKYLVGLDGLSLLLFMLTTLMGPIVILSSWESVTKYLPGYYSMLLLLQTASMGVFASLDLIVFYVFFELSLIPMYFLIGIWGGKGRIHATVKFFLYTLVGSLIMLVGLIWVGYDAGTFIEGVSFSSDWRFLSGSEYTIGLVEQTWLFLAFALAFCIKVPLFPFHTWLPYAHTEAPTAGSVVLAAIMLKMGTYGLLRICLPIFPNAFTTFAPYLATLAVVGIIYGALVAMVQKDVKKLVAYSSVSHLGFVVLGLFAFNTIAVQGALIQMVNHGLSTGALFLVVGMIYDRAHTRRIADFGGIARIMPVFAVVFMISTLASIGLPGLNGFVGEFLILNGAFISEVLPQNAWTVFAATGVILAAVYMLWMYQRVMFGPVTNEENKNLVDLNAREIGLMVPLIVFMIWIGIRPVDFTQYSEAQVSQLLESSRDKSTAVLRSASPDELPAWAGTLYDVSPQMAEEAGGYSIDGRRKAALSTAASTASQTNLQTNPKRKPTDEVHVMAKPLSEDEIQEAIGDRLPGWSHDDDKLTKEFGFSDFREAFAFLTRIAFEAEDQVHHPEIYNVYKTVVISLSTHDAGGKVTEKDLKLAAAIESLYTN